MYDFEGERGRRGEGWGGIEMEGREMREREVERGRKGEKGSSGEKKGERRGRG